MRYVLGAPILSTDPTGFLTMRIGQDARRSVVFFGITQERGIEYGGTGFLLADKQDGVVLPFLITCRHVAVPLSRFEEFFIRFNKKDGTAEDVPVIKAGWCISE